MIPIGETFLWLAGSIPPLIAGIGLLARFSKKGFPPVYPCATGDICIGMYSIFFLLGRLLSSAELIFFGVASVCGGFYSAMKFFKMMTGSHKKYITYLSKIGALLAIITTVDVFLEPATFSECTVIFSPLERAGMLGMLAVLLVIQVNYATSTVRRVRDESLKYSFLIFPVLIAAGMSLIVILYPLTVIQALPTVVVIIPTWFAFTAETILVARFPAAMFMSPALPLLIEVRDLGGKILFQRTFPAAGNSKPAPESLQGAFDGVLSCQEPAQDNGLKVRKIVFDDITVLVDQSTESRTYMLFKNPHDLIDNAFAIFSKDVSHVLSIPESNRDRNLEPEMNASFLKAFTFLPVLHKRNG